jgi:hypothetical protein
MFVPKSYRASSPHLLFSKNSRPFVGISFMDDLGCAPHETALIALRIDATDTVLRDHAKASRSLLTITP